MKSRSSFVSNSSTSSFLIYGIIVSDLNFLTSDLDIDIDTMIEDLKLDLVTHSPDGDDTYVERSWDNVKDDQTGKQFKESVEADVTKLFKLVNTPKCKTHEYAWRDG